jgi:hypothetical protein
VAPHHPAQCFFWPCREGLHGDSSTAMAEPYHPYRVATLDPDLNEPTERRMEEINAAYNILERTNANE